MESGKSPINYPSSRPAISIDGIFQSVARLPRAGKWIDPSFPGIKIASLLLAGCICNPIAASAQSAPPHAEQSSGAGQLTEAEAVQRGEKVVADWDKCDYGFVDMTADFKLYQKDQAGKQVERDLTLRLLEINAHDQRGLKTKGDWSVVSFRSPADVAGTALLVHANLRQNDDTWVYLPSLKRVKRISSSNQSGNFAGTEFAFEDIASQEFYKFTYKWLRSEACGAEQESAACDVVEQIPTYPKSGYSKQIAWYDGCRQRRIDYYDHNDALYKTQTFNDYRQYHGKHWRGHDNVMVNHRTGRSTRLVIPKFVYRNDFQESMFRPAALSVLQ